MARPSSQEIRERIDLERQRNADLVNALQNEARCDDAGATSMTLAAYDALAAWLRNEAIRLETSTRRADTSARKEYRTAASVIETIATSIRQHGLAGDSEPPAVPKIEQAPAPACGATYVSTSDETWICAEPSDHVATGNRQHRTADGKCWYEPAAESASSAADVAAYISGDADMPPAALAPLPPALADAVAEHDAHEAQRATTVTAVVVEELAQAPVPVSLFVDPPLIEPADVAYDLASPGLPYAGGTYGSMFADPAPAGAAPFRRSLVTFASLAAAPACAPPDHRSVSQITSYSDCGLKYRLQRRDGVPEQPQWASIGGSAFHAAVEQMERAAAGAGAELNSNGVGWQEAGACFDLDQLWLACFNHEISETCAKNPDWPQDSWRASNRGAEGYTWWLAEGVDMLRRYVAWRTEWDKEYVIARAADGTPIIEYEFVLNVDGVPIKGVIDSAWSHRSTGRLIVIDDKSGSRKPDDDLQLRTYGYALLYVAGVPVLDTPESWSGVYFNARKGETSPPVPVITSDGWAELRYRVHAMDAADRAGIHLPRPSSFCGGCGVKYACPLRSR